MPEKQNTEKPYTGWGQPTALAYDYLHILIEDNAERGEKEQRQTRATLIEEVEGKIRHVTSNGKERRGREGIFATMAIPKASSQPTHLRRTPDDSPGDPKSAFTRVEGSSLGLLCSLRIGSGDTLSGTGRGKSMTCQVV